MNEKSKSKTRISTKKLFETYGSNLGTFWTKIYIDSENLAIPKCDS